MTISQRTWTDLLLTSSVSIVEQVTYTDNGVCVCVCVWRESRGEGAVRRVYCRLMHEHTEEILSNESCMMFRMAQHSHRSCCSWFLCATVHRQS
jgi:hypothetical protein